jgi:hypothetical protein
MLKYVITIGTLIKVSFIKITLHIKRKELLKFIKKVKINVD